MLEDDVDLVLELLLEVDEPSVEVVYTVDEVVIIVTPELLVLRLGTELLVGVGEDVAIAELDEGDEDVALAELDEGDKELGGVMTN